MSAVCVAIDYSTEKESSWENALLDSGISVGDSLSGRVLFPTAHGSVIRLQNGLKGFMFYSAPAGTRLLAGIKKIDHLKMRIIIVPETIYYDEANSFDDSQLKNPPA